MWCEYCAVICYQGSDVEEGHHDVTFSFRPARYLTTRAADHIVREISDLGEKVKHVSKLQTNLCPD